MKITLLKREKESARWSFLKVKRRMGKHKYAFGIRHVDRRIKRHR